MIEQEKKKRVLTPEQKARKSATAKVLREKSKDQILARRKIYYAENRDEIIEKARMYREGNKEKISATNKAWREKNKALVRSLAIKYYSENTGKAAEYAKAYRKINIDQCAAYKRNRRALKRKSEFSHTGADIKAIFESQRGLCANCTTKLFKSGAKKYHVDHIHPLAKGGSNDKYNLQCLCPACNMRKNAKDPLDWAKENGKLI